MPKLSIFLFGSPRIDVDGTPVEADTRKAAALLAYLAVSGGVHQRDALAGLLWPDYDQTSARAALRRTLSALNRALHSTGAGDGEGSVFLQVTRETIGMASDAPAWLDVAAFRALAGAPKRHGHGGDEICAQCIEALRDAAALYREPFMAGFHLRDSSNFEEWQFFQEETLRRELAQVLERLALGLEASGAVEEAIQAARRWLALDPLLEEAHRHLMLLYAYADQRSAALRQYRVCVRVLDEELGVPPLEETTRLYENILNHADLPRPGERLRLVQAPLNGKSKPQKAEPEMEREPETPKAQEQPMVGRGGELASLIETWRSAGADGRLVGLEGEAGIGKTRLAGAFLQWARKHGSRVVQARCYSGESGLAYAPFLQALNEALALPGATERLAVLRHDTLAEAARLLPGLPARAPETGGQPQNTIATAGGSLQNSEPLENGGPLENSGRQARFFAALRETTQALLTGGGAGSAPGVLFLDDLHWADSATLELLAYLARRLSGTGLLILAAWRDEASPTVQSLQRLVSDLAREGSGRGLALRRLSADAVAELVRLHPAGQSQPESLAARLFQESEGLPFVAVEYLAALHARPDGPWEMPASVRDLLRSRLTGLDAATQQLLSAAAVIGRSFDFPTLRETSGRSELETVDGLDNLLSTGLVAESSAAGEVHYDFAHEKLRELIYEETSLTRRRLLHRRAADTLARTPGSADGLVAFHFSAAGQDSLASEYHRRAGERARLLFANTEAMAHYEAALAAGHPDQSGLREAIGDLHTLRGDYARALTSYHTAAALCTPGCISRLEHKLGSVHQRMGEWDLAESHYQASLEAADDDPAFTVHLHADRAMAAYSRGDMQQAEGLSMRALELAHDSADAHALAQAYNTRGVLARARGDLAAAVEALEASLRAAEMLEDPLARIAALNNLALVHGEQNQVREAIGFARQALALCQQRGDRHRQAALHNNLADLLHRCGEEEEAMHQLKQAVAIFAEIGSPALTAPDSAEIWKLTVW